ncbi:MAG TPA: hypothetical protein VHU81_19890 [Thermoanaerobaculia bacterium]|nr:hypothetical protein [Thermoanaerobaculia bacterium]
MTRLRWAALATSALLLGLTAGHERSSFTPRISPRFAPLPAPAHGDEEGREIGEREYLAHWLESRHRTAPGVDWRAIEEKNLLANLALAASRPGPRPVWRERGPFNVTGSTVATIVATDGKTLMLATSQGGVFSGVPGTLVWKRLADGLGGYVRGFTVSARPEVWAAAVVSRENGAQVYASRNRGVAWAPARGLPPLSSVYEMLQDGDRRTVYLLARLGEDAGFAPILARSRDGGLSFAVVLTGDGSERPGIWTSRTARGPLYLLFHGRLEISTDQGSTFEPVSVLDETVRYAILRGSEAGGPTLYAAVGTSGAPQNLYASEDGGQTWERRFRFEDPATIASLFGGALAASIQDPNLVLFGGVEAWRSTDGGRSFERPSSWRDYYGRPADRLHADINGLHFSLYRGQEVLFLSTDGGTYQSLDGGSTVQNLTAVGLPIGQFYSTWSSDSDPNLYLAGSQDQGLQLSLPPGRGARPGSPLFHDQLISGDYGNLTAASHDMSDVFAIYPTFPPNPGGVVLFGPGGDGLILVYGDQPTMTRSGFYAAAVADPDDPSSLYVAGDSIWKLRHRGDGTFAQERLPQSFSVGGSDYLISLAIAPSDHDIWYAGTFLGRLWYSRDHGRTWTESETTRTALPFTSNSALLVATDDPFTCYAGGSGYGSPPVLVTRDGGATWEPLDRGLPSTLVWSLAFDNPTRQRLYAATEAGPYAYDPAAKIWRSLLGGGAPVARYYSVEGVPAAGVVRFGTYSRGIWDYVAPAR